MAESRICPDEGTCHHRCRIGCFRVAFCEPLSGVYEDDRWPESMSHEYVGEDTVTEAIVTGNG